MNEGRAPMPPVAQLLGWTLLSTDPGRGEIRVRFEAKPDFLNPAGTVQGGILSAMNFETRTRPLCCAGPQREAGYHAERGPAQPRPTIRVQCQDR
jgi:hypothetical protein